MAGALVPSLLHYARLPFTAYNRWLERRPVVAKALTSGAMYSAGDMIAQYAEHYRRVRGLDGGPGVAATEEGAEFAMDWRRAAIFFVYGTVIAGPLYHVWFSRLDLLPAALFQLRQHRYRAEILRAYALLKRHGIEVNLKVEKLPSAKPFSKWTERGIKIAADQLVFSSLYTVVFFLAIGMLTGGVDKYMAERRLRDLHDYEQLLHTRLVAHSDAKRPAAGAGVPTSTAVPRGGSGGDAPGGGTAVAMAPPADVTPPVAATAPPAKESWWWPSSSAPAGAATAVAAASVAAASARSAASEAGVAAAATGGVAGSAASTRPSYVHTDEEEQESIDHVLGVLREEQAKKVMTWGSIARESWDHMTAKFLPT